MKQSRKASFAETCLSTAIGVIFTVVSIARGYMVRRLFEHLRVKAILR